MAGESDESQEEAAAGDQGPGQADEIREQYETIVRVLPDPVFALDENGYLTYTNRAFDEQFGYGQLESTEGLHFSDITTDEGTDTVRSMLRDLIQADEEQASRSLELEGQTADGRTLDLEGSIGLLPYSGSFEGAAGVMRDVTAEQRQAEVFEVMDRALRHNLRTVVNIISGYAGLIEDEVGESHAHYLEEIQDGAEWLGKLGETLRTLQNAIDESLERSGAIAVETFVEAAIETVRETNPEADIESHYAAHGHIDGGGPLEYAIENVVENAVVHNDAETPEVNVWISHATREGWIDIHVEDNGPGIPQAERDIVLGNADITQLQHGSGIGLWITRWVVQAFDGAVEIEANDPRGTVVSFQLPLTDAEPPAESDTD
ncbi:MAG: ATP-binding protein [Halobacteriales archaeon]